MRFAERTTIRPRHVVALCAAVVACLSCQAPPAPELDRSAEPSGVSMVARADEGAVIAAHRGLIRAMQDGDVEAACAHLLHNDRLLVFHPFLENRFEGYEETREGLSRMLARVKDIEWTEVHQTVDMEGSVAWLTSQILVKAPGLEPPFVGRGTEIWVREHGKWLLAHGHWSEHARLAGSRQDG